MTTAEPPMRARPTTYNGIRMRSRLEARVAAWLDLLGTSWAYEPQAFASEDGQYLPDFAIATSVRFLPSPMYLEVKGRIDYPKLMRTEDYISGIVSASDPRAVLAIADARMLEDGEVASYNFPVLGEWYDGLMVDLFVRSGATDLCDHWRMPAWDK